MYRREEGQVQANKSILGREDALPEPVKPVDHASAGEANGRLRRLIVSPRRTYGVSPQQFTRHSYVSGTATCASFPTEHSALGLKSVGIVNASLQRTVSIVHGVIAAWLRDRPSKRRTFSPELA